MIRRTNQFLHCAWGRSVALLLVFSILLLTSSCVAYKQSPIAMGDLKSNERIQAQLANYNFYVHDAQGVYAFKDIRIVGDGDLNGRLEKAQISELTKGMTAKERKAWWKEHKYDIHIYTKGGLRDAATLVSYPADESDRVTVTNNMVDKVTVASFDVKKTFSETATVLVIILGAIALVVVVWVLLASDDGGGGGGGGSESGGGSDSEGDGSD